MSERYGRFSRAIKYIVESSNAQGGCLVALKMHGPSYCGALAILLSMQTEIQVVRSMLAALCDIPFYPTLEPDLLISCRQPKYSILDLSPGNRPSRVICINCIVRSNAMLDQQGTGMSATPMSALR